MKDERTGCIYIITNLMNGKMYIGLTTQDISSRFKQHMNNPNKLLKKDIDKYGKHNFSIELLTTKGIPRDRLADIEINYILIYNPEYNIINGGGLGSGLFGEDCPVAKLSTNEIIEIREKWSSGRYTQVMLGKEYNVGNSNISKIVLGKTRVTEGGNIQTTKTNKYIIRNSGSINDEIVEEIRNKFRNEKVSVGELSKMYNIDRSYIGKIVAGKVKKSSPGPITKTKRVMLTPEQALEIRILCRDTSMSYSDIGKKFGGAHRSTISKIAKGINHKKVKGPIKGVDY